MGAPSSLAAPFRGRHGRSSASSSVTPTPCTSSFTSLPPAGKPSHLASTGFYSSLQSIPPPFHSLFHLLPSAPKIRITVQILQLQVKCKECSCEILLQWTLVSTHLIWLAFLTSPKYIFLYLIKSISSTLTAWPDAWKAFLSLSG